MNKLKRYVIFLIGLFFSSMGVSLVTKASLGTSSSASGIRAIRIFYRLDDAVIYICTAT